ncbi:LysR family transcriptional regulator [Brevundimonas sp.]|uniref:LysR family transcriptional regulator n=1 Tax=Brevundimonas sp. TaxID=1871086 RepID=UPI0028A67067|nr:LysR family transcriptional regulator [Brevundimonas sp.]
MTLERLRIFVAVAERDHVTAAARALNLTQSAVSNALAALEAEHQVRLFDRVGRGVALNATGRAFLPEAKAVLARAAAAEAALADLSALRRGRLAVFASQTIASYWLPRRLVDFHTAHPGVELDVQIGNTREVAQAVLNGAAEIGLVEGVVDAPALTQVQVGSDRLAVVVTPDHPWAFAKRLSAGDLIESSWVLREPGSGTRSSLEAALREAGVNPADLPVAMTLPANEAVLAAAEAGAGATALSESVARASVAAGRLVRAPFSLPERPFRLLRHSDRYRSRAGDAFVQALA